MITTVVIVAAMGIGKQGTEDESLRISLFKNTALVNWHTCVLATSVGKKL